MQEEYYFNNLYPLQDKVLKMIDRLQSSFYNKQVDDILSELNNTFSQSLSISLKEDNFVRLFIYETETELKIDFINDIPFYYGDTVSSSLFSKTDNIRNILSNKISALLRDEPKDFADLLFISLSFPFNWQDVINEAKQKDTWVNELDISKCLYEFSSPRLNGLKWIGDLDVKKYEEQLKQNGGGCFK